MRRLPRSKNEKDVDIRQFDNEVIDVYKPDNKSYPVIERMDNALLWPEKIKDGIDVDETNSVTHIPIIPTPTLEPTHIPTDKNYIPE